MKSKHTYRFLRAYLLVIILFFQMFFEAFLLIDYYINTEHYAAHCINDLNPELECNGSCHLHEIVDGMDEKHKVNLQKEITHSVYLATSILKAPLSIETYTSDKKQASSDIVTADNYLHSLFRPPRQLA